MIGEPTSHIRVLETKESPGWGFRCSMWPHLVLGFPFLPPARVWPGSSRGSPCECGPDPSSTTQEGESLSLGGRHIPGLLLISQSRVWLLQRSSARGRTPSSCEGFPFLHYTATGLCSWSSPGHTQSWSTNGAGLEAGIAGQGSWSRTPESGPPPSEGRFPHHLSLIFSKRSSGCFTVEKGGVEG